jgi:hypothetical protein
MFALGNRPGPALQGTLPAQQLLLLRCRVALRSLPVSPAYPLSRTRPARQMNQKCSRLLASTLPRGPGRDAGQAHSRVQKHCIHRRCLIPCFSAITIRNLTHGVVTIARILRRLLTPLGQSINVPGKPLQSEQINIITMFQNALHYFRTRALASLLAARRSQSRLRFFLLPAKKFIYIQANI